jgi:uncharacterized membrane protein
MLIAARKRSRTAWLTGAALMAVVIGKLFLVDLSRIGSIERIISFVGVGLLMLVVGYFSPLPPPERSAPADTDEPPAGESSAPRDGPAAAAEHP